MAKLQLNGAARFIISHLAIIGAVVGGLITVGCWLQSTNASITILTTSATEAKLALILKDEKDTQQDLTLARSEEKFNYIKDSLIEIKADLKTHIEKK